MGEMLPPLRWGSVRWTRRIREWNRTVARPRQRLPWEPTAKGTGRRRGDERAGGDLDVRALRRRASGELDMRVRRERRRQADRPRRLEPGADPDQPPPPGPDRPPRAPGAPGAGGVTRGPWHPATQLEILHAAPAFAVVGIGL